MSSTLCSVVRSFIHKQKLTSCFKPCTGVEAVDLMSDKENPAVNRGFGFVSFYNHTAAEVARRYLGTPDYR